MSSNPNSLAREAGINSLKRIHACAPFPERERSINTSIPFS